MSNRINLFTGRQLVENGCKHDQSLPTKGPKSSLPSGTRLEQKQIESALEDRRHALQHQRIEKIGSLSQALWLDEERKALVTEKKGTYWLHIGHTVGHHTYIYPEEILHLLEMNALDLKYGGVTMSLQQAYTKFIGKLISMDEYRVYSNLSRQGYKLIRHKQCHVDHESLTNEEIISSLEDVPSTSKHSNTQIIDTRTKNKKQSEEAKGDYLDLNESSSDDCMMVNDSTTSDVHKSSEKQNVALIESDSDDSSHGTDVVCLPSCSLKNKILSNIPNCYKKTYLTLKVPDAKYIPHNIAMDKYHYIIMLDKFINTENVDQENSAINNRIKYESLQYFCRHNIFANNNQFFNNIMQNLLSHNNAARNQRNYKTSMKPNTELNKHKFSRKPLTSGHSSIQEITNQNIRKSNDNDDSLKHNKTHRHVTDTNIVKPSTIKESHKIAETKHDPKNEEMQNAEGIPCASNVISKKQNILNKIQLLLETYSSVAPGNKTSEIKEALILAIIKFNHTFEEHYTLVFSENSCTLKKMHVEDIVETRDPNILELSSDSDSPPQKLLRVDSNVPTASKNMSIKTTVRTKRRKLSSRLSHNINSSDDSSDENLSVVDPQKLHKSGKGNSTQQDSIKNWFVKDSWSKPEIGKGKKKENYISGVGLKIASAILDNIKELSYKKDCPIESWSQGKQLYKDKITSNIVCISDDEMFNEDSNNADVDSVSPLLRPEDCTSVEAIMKRLQIVDSSQQETNGVSPEKLTFKISYDMYYPTSKTLRKSDLSPPPFSVIIVSDKSPLPSPLELSQIRRSLHKDVSFLLAVVSFDTISYLQMDNVVLPEMIRTSDW